MTEGDLTYRIATIPGDGVGPEVVAAARRVVDAVGERFGVRVGGDGRFPMADSKRLPRGCGARHR